MLPVAPYPMLRLAFVLASGILTGIYFPSSFYGKFEGLLIGIVLFGLAFLSSHLFFKVARALIAYTLVFFIGALVYTQSKEILNPCHFSKIDSFDAYVAVVSGECIEKPYSVSTEVKVKAVLSKGVWKEAIGQILVSFPKQADLKYGDLFLIKSAPKKTESARNPFQFDYGKYLAYQSIYHQQYIPAESYVFLGNQPESLVWKYAYQAREKLSSMLSAIMGNGEEFAVASMLILGIKQKVSPALMEAYSASGAIHVLAVSGLHVGLIFGLIELLLGRYVSRLNLKPLFYLLSLVSIWAFGFITAFSPSVVRAVVMFTIVIFGKWLGKKGSLYNTLGCTAFFILFFSPSMLMNVGFELSFLSVMGIAYFHPKILAFWQTENKITKWIWEITCISVSAQLATLPLCLYYFNQYPVYSLVSNLWAVPLSSAVLYVGIVFYLGSFSFFVKVWVGTLLKGIVWALNKSMSLVLYLPNPVSKTIYFSVLEAWLLAVVIILCVLLFQTRKRHYLSLALLVSVFYSFARVQKHWEVRDDDRMVFFSLRQYNCFALVEGQRARIWADSAFCLNRELLKSQVIKPLMVQGIFNAIVDTLPPTNFEWETDGFKLHFLQSQIIYQQNVSFQASDYVYIKNPCRKWRNLVPFDKVKQVILPHQKCFDSLVNKANVWDLQQSGALEVHLSPHGKYSTRSN